jgi:hypothetical protein
MQLALKLSILEGLRNQESNISHQSLGALRGINHQNADRELSKWKRNVFAVRTLNPEPVIVTF